jgi:hypothetical protein
VLYARNGDKVTLLVDREVKSLAAANSIEDDYGSSSGDVYKRSLAGSDVYLGGFSSTDDIQTDRLNIYNNYTGCMSSKFFIQKSGVGP